MKIRSSRALGGLTMVALALAVTAGRAEAGGRSVPYVLELFTSQGCSSCPPANANLIRLRERGDLLALSFSVTYWDRLGWKDVFGKPDYTARQEAYEAHLGHGGPFTPQMVVNGGRDVVGIDLGEIKGLLAGGHLPQTPAIALSDSAVDLGAGKAPAAGADIWLVRYEPGVIKVAVRSGENTGRTLPHGNVVRSLTRLGRWSGTPTSQSFPAAAAGLRTAVLVQLPGGGAILAAATD